MSDRPIWLEATPLPGGVSLRVLGKSSTPIDARFSLEVEVGTNRSVHHGTAVLAGNEVAVLSSITAAGDLGSGWHAVLQVAPAGAKPYEQAERAT